MVAAFHARQRRLLGTLPPYVFPRILLGLPDFSLGFQPRRGRRRGSRGAPPSASLPLMEWCPEHTAARASAPLNKLGPGRTVGPWKSGYQPGIPAGMGRLHGLRGTPPTALLPLIEGRPEFAAARTSAPPSCLAVALRSKTADRNFGPNLWTETFERVQKPSSFASLKQFSKCVITGCSNLCTNRQDFSGLKVLNLISMCQRVVPNASKTSDCRYPCSQFLPSGWDLCDDRIHNTHTTMQKSPKTFYGHSQ